MKNFIKGSAVLLIGDLLTKVISVLYLIPLVRIDKNIILLMTNLLIPFGFFVVFSTVGINIILTNELVKAKNEIETKKALLNVGIIIAFCSILGSILMFFISPALMHTIELNTEYANALTNSSRILTIGIILFGITSYMRSILMAYGSYTIISITYITEQIIKVGIILLGAFFTIVLNDADVTIIVYIISFAIIISMTSTLLAYLYHFAKNKYQDKFVQGEYTFKLSDIKFLIISSLILFSGGIYLTLFDQIDLLLVNNQMLSKGYTLDQINQFKSEYFTLSMKIVMVPISISSAFIQVMIKQIGEAKNQKSEINKIIYLVSLYSIFMVCAIMLLGNNIFTLFYREASIGILTVQSLIIPVYIFKNIIGGYIITNDGSQKSILLSTFIIIVAKVILDLLFFNIFSIYGYVLSSIASLIIGTIILIYMNKELFVKIPVTAAANSIMYLKAGILIFISYILFKILPPVTITTSNINIILILLIKGLILTALFLIVFLPNIKFISRSN